jgi:hypothetical protein
MWVPHVSISEAGNVPVRVRGLVGPWAASLARPKGPPWPFYNFLYSFPFPFSGFLICFKEFANLIQISSNKVLNYSKLH